MDEQYLKSKEIIDEIYRRYSNFKKDGSSRKSQEYLENQKQTFDQCWDSFQQENAKLEKFRESHPTHAYFTESIKDKLEGYINSVRSEIRSLLPKMQVRISEEQMKRYKLHSIRLSKMRQQIDNIKLEITDMSKDNLEETIEELSLLWKQICDNHEQIDVHQSENENIEFEKQTEYWTEMQVYFKEIRNRLKKAIKETVNDNISERYNNLPQINIPDFSGNYQDWIPFRDLFLQTIDKRNIGKAVKMNYLMSKLKGNASQLIRHLQISAENYDEAWQMITNRYNNTRVLVFTQLNILTSQKEIRVESAWQLRKLHDTTKEVLHTLKTLGVDTQSWDAIVVHIILPKIDNESRRIYEQSLEKKKEIQPIDELLCFIEGRFQTLEALSSDKIESNGNRIGNDIDVKPEVCKVCLGIHKIYKCQRFLSLNTSQRSEQCKMNHICENCLNVDHEINQCKSQRFCYICKKKHNTLLHKDDQMSQQRNDSKYQNTQRKDFSNFKQPSFQKTNQVFSQNNQKFGQHQINPFKKENYYGDRKFTNVNSHHVEQKTQENTTLLPTAVVEVSSGGRQYTFRALIDQGSQASFITEKAVQLMKLHKEKSNIRIVGTGESDAGIARGKVSFMIHGYHKYSQNIEALVLNKLAAKIPNEYIESQKWEHIKYLQLADPTYNIPSEVDIILGAEIYTDIIIDGIIKGGNEAPIAQNTKIGWILSGRTTVKERPKFSVSHVSQIEFQEEIKKYWESEEISCERKFTEEEEKCEILYANSYQRESNGRFTVKLPLKNESLCTLGNSKKMAIARLLQQEKKFAKNKKYKDEYIQTMRDLEEKGHMVKVNENENQNQMCYLPHQAVIKESSSTTKLRVVFDASAKTSTGVALNDIMYTGPTIQQDLFNIILRGRKHKVQLVADITQMYRQINLAQEHQDYQRIVWRESVSNPIMEYKMSTVLFGTSAAPYLAIKTLQQLAKNERRAYEIGAKTILHDFYVDDLITGANSVEDAMEIYRQVNSVLERGGFSLRKWGSNSKEVLRRIPEDIQELEIRKIELDNSIKMLGIHWTPNNDTFGFKVNLNIEDGVNTKRQMLSDSSKMFDPMGWLSPTTIIPKMMIQKLWILEIDWDDKLPDNLQVEWKRYQQKLHELENIKIPRWTYNSKSQKFCEIHGFCDASEKAYAAVVYSKVTLESGQIKITLLTAKTKLAPIKSKITLPKLELCGAVLLAKLIEQVKIAMEYEIDTPVYTWTDSMIVLAWIRAGPIKWKTFVANRVSEILEITDSKNWNHVKSEDNPADCASRGINPSELKNHTLWWCGPTWLQSNHNGNNEQIITMTTVEEKKPMKMLMMTQIEDSIFSKYSSLNKLVNIIAYCRRFIKACAKRPIENSTTISKEESSESIIVLTKWVQKEEYKHEIQAIENKLNVSDKSKLSSLNPFLDSQGILRVGGRLQEANIPYDEKHPIILPYNHPFSNMIIDKAHKETMHGGTQLTLNTIRQKYWIINGKNSVRYRIHKCIICFRYKTRESHQLMGNLPKSRVNPSRPFTHTGVDYAGPMDIRMSKGRGNKSYKGYIAIFVCLATKAIHLEVVSDLTAQAFIAAFKRFIARRGRVSDMYSDNGTNFVGADNILKKDIKALKKSFDEDIYKELLKDGTQWHFIPPASPHFGGLWEAGVKSMKYHLKRIMGNSTLTYEEMSTTVTQIEACLNSRPICPLTNDPQDLGALTPGHFLIGSALISQPEVDITGIHHGRLTRWQLIQKLQQEFWKIWSTEYLSRLQQRPKWANKQKNIEIDDLVLIKDEQLPPGKWPLGRIVKTHPGKDELTRVVTIRTNRGEIKRPITKICPLPINEKLKTTTNEIVQAHTTTIRQRGPSMSKFLWNLMMITCIFQLLATSVVETTKIKPFTNNAGIYFEELGQVKLTSNEWNLLIYIDLAIYDQEFDEFDKLMIDLEKLFTNNKNWGLNYKICRAIMSELRLQKNNIQENNRFLHKNKSDRKKRSPFDIIGSIQNGLFGVLDQEFARQHEEDINSVKENQLHLLNMLKNHSSIEESTMNIFKKDRKDIMKQFEEINVQFATMQLKAETTDITQTFFAIAMHMSLIMNMYQRTQESLVNMIINVEHGKLHPQLLSPRQLLNQLALIRKHLPKTLSIPGDYDDEEITRMYKHLNAKARVTEKFVIISVRIPLVSSEQYQLFRIISVPTEHGDKYAYIEPSSDYLAINLNRDRYFPIKENELQSCKDIEDQQYMCKQNKPIYNTKSTVSQCEIKIISHIRKLDNTCKTKIIPRSNVWIKLQHTSSWIYILDQEYTFNINCHSSIETITLKGSGILELENNCKMNQETMTIFAFSTFSNRFNASIIPVTNLSQQIQNMTKETQIFTRHIDNVDTLKDLATIEQRIIDQREYDTLPNKLSNHDLHHYSLAYTLLVCIIILTLIVAFKKKCTKKTVVKLVNGQEEIELKDIVRNTCHKTTCFGECGATEHKLQLFSGRGECSGEHN